MVTKYVKITKSTLKIVVFVIILSFIAIFYAPHGKKEEFSKKIPKGWVCIQKDNGKVYSHGHKGIRKYE